MRSLIAVESTRSEHWLSFPAIPKHPSPAVAWKCRCKGHQTCFVRSSSVVSPILLQVQNTLARGWGRQHPLLRWEGEAAQCGAGSGLAAEAQGAAFWAKPHQASRCLRGSSGFWHQLGSGDSLPILYKFSPVLMSQTFSSQGSFVFHPSCTRLFSCLRWHEQKALEQKAGSLWDGASRNHNITWGFPVPLPPCSCFRIIWHYIFQLTILTAIWL